MKWPRVYWTVSNCPLNSYIRICDWQTWTWWLCSYPRPGLLCLFSLCVIHTIWYPEHLIWAQCHYWGSEKGGRPPFSWSPTPTWSPPNPSLKQYFDTNLTLSPPPPLCQPSLPLCHPSPTPSHPSLFLFTASISIRESDKQLLHHGMWPTYVTHWKMWHAPVKHFHNVTPIGHFPWLNIVANATDSTAVFEND